MDPPIRVSERERDDFIAKFNKRIRVNSWVLYAVIVLYIIILERVIRTFSDGIYLSMGVILGAAIIIPTILHYDWAWDAPSRELKHRTPEGLP